MGLPQGKKSKKRQPKWHEFERKSRIIGHADVDVLLNFVSEIKIINKSLPYGQYFFKVARPDRIHFTGEQWLNNLSCAAVEKMIKNGHVDSHIFFHLYPQIYNPKMRRFEFVHNYCSAFRIDIDDHPYCSSIYELREFFKDKRVLMPGIIEQTGERNFHVSYSGPPGVFTKTIARDFACQLSDITSIPANKKEIAEIVKERAGIDWQYLNMDFIHHTIRAPGSVKCKNDGKAFVVKTWYNTDYNCFDPFNPKDKSQRYKKVHAMAPVGQVRQIKEARDKKISQEIHKKSIGIISKEVKAVLGRSPSTEKIIALIADNVTFLKKGRFAIHQTTMAEQWGIGQKTVSRLLKKLCEAGVLAVSRRYVHIVPGDIRNKAQEYGLGSVLRKALGVQNKEKKIKDNERLRESASVRTLQEPFQRGETNQAFLKDLRIAFSLGVSKEDFVEFAIAKFNTARSESRKERRWIENAWDSWDGKFYSSSEVSNYGFTRSSYPLIDISEFTREFSGEETFANAGS